MAFNDFLKKLRKRQSTRQAAPKTLPRQPKLSTAKKSSSWIATRQKRSVCGAKTRPRPTLKPMRSPKALQRPGAAHLLLKAASF